MRWIVVGSNGMLGRDLTTMLSAQGHEVTGVDRDTVDITDAAACHEAVTGHDVVVNCAAYTAVDAAEGDEPAAFAVNAVGAGHLARAAHRARARMVQVSTDYVFRGAEQVPYAEDAPVAPQSAYGRTKLAGEWAVRAECPDHLVVRTAWLYGAHGRSFPSTIARVARERGSVQVIDDQVGQPTWTVDLSDLILRLVAREAPAGTYHGTSGGLTSWFDFARAVVVSAGLDASVVQPTTTAAFGALAQRPAFSVLSHGSLTAAGVEPIGPWDERWALAAADVLG